MRILGHAILICTVLALAACGGTTSLPLLSATDTARPDGSAFFYVTDRATETSRDDTITYTARRNPSMGFGLARIDMDGRNPDLRAVRETLRFPPTPLPFSQEDGIIVLDADATRAYDAMGAELRETLAQALHARGQRDVLLYIHGFNSRFDQALETTARLWDAVGRGALPVAYSWPAGNPGAFAYFRDREGGEFSIFHLKETLRLLRDLPGLGRIHIVAHSRGSDVVTTALRELIIEERAAGRNPLQSLRVETLILAAPDLDFSVVQQRLIAERFGPAFRRITVYMNPDDGVLGVAQLLMAGTRFGRLSFEDLGENEREIFRRIDNVDFINVSGVTGQSSHNYFRNNPEVLADMAQVIATGARPDSPDRNLIRGKANFWRLVLPRDPTPGMRREGR